MKRFVFILIILVATMMLFTSNGRSQLASEERRRLGRDDKVCRKELPEMTKRHWEKIEMIWMWKLTKELNLDEARAAKLFPLLNQYERKKWELEKTQKRLLGELRELLKKDKPDEKEISKVIEKIEDNFKNQGKIKQEELEKLKEIFSAQELGQYILIRHQFFKDIQEIIRNIRKGRSEYPLKKRFEKRNWNED